jgi:nickel/cobalt transporter (NicO) family protein
MNLRRVSVFGLAIGVLTIFGPGAASAHPLGNFTVNTATQLVVGADETTVTYVVDMAEIPALKIRQELGAPSGVVPTGPADLWRDRTCRELLDGLRVTRAERADALTVSASTLTFPAGQAGLSTLRLECEARIAGGPAAYSVNDTNYADRIGWREMSVVGSGQRVSGDVATSSPTDLLRAYPSGAVSSPSDQRSISFSTSPGRASSESSNRATGSTNRGNDGLTQRFQGLLAHRNLTLPFAIGAMFLATLLGGLHALAPGHGKTLMAAYAVSRRGTKADILTIGATVALTHTIGIVILGALVSATSVVSPDRTLRWASVVSGLLVVGVGITLVRSRFRVLRASRHSAAYDHSHGHDHSHDHDHPHPHPHRHPHPHEHDDEGAHVRPHPTDPRFVVTSHAHGGWSHEHVLPAPNAMVRRRELVAMGLAGGLVPSPSALVVLLGAIALGRIPFGLALVGAYGVGLALTLVGAGLLLVRFDQSIRNWASRLSSPRAAYVTTLTNALPLVSGFAIGGAGLLLVIRAAAQL